MHILSIRLIPAVALLENQGHSKQVVAMTLVHG